MLTPEHLNRLSGNVIIPVWHDTAYSTVTNHKGSEPGGWDVDVQHRPKTTDVCAMKRFCLSCQQTQKAYL